LRSLSSFGMTGREEIGMTGRDKIGMTGQEKIGMPGKNRDEIFRTEMKRQAGIPAMRRQ